MQSEIGFFANGAEKVRFGRNTSVFWIVATILGVAALAATQPPELSLEGGSSAPAVSASDDHRRPILGACGAITGWVWRPKGVDPPFVAETGSGSSKWCVWKKMTRCGECERAIIGLEDR